MAYYRSLTFAETTKKSYSTHLSAFLEYCRLTNQQPWEINVQNTLRFIAYLAQKLQYTSITQYANIIRLMCLESGVPNPLQTWPVRSLMKGIKRAKGNAVKHKLPITPGLLMQIRRMLTLTKPMDCILWAAYVTAFFTLLRKSNIVPPSPAQFDPLRHPIRGDLHLTPKGIALTVKRSKTNQYQERAPQLPIPYLKDHPLCPTSALLAVLALKSDLPPSAPLFAYPTHQGLFPLTQSVFTRTLHKLLLAIGIPADEYGSHSFRRGGATWAFKAGLPGEVIQILGDWQSDCYKQYLDLDINVKFQLMTIFTNNLPKD